MFGCGQGTSDKKQKFQEENVGKEKNADQLEINENLVFQQDITVKNEEKERFCVYQDDEIGKVLMKVGKQKVKLSRISRDMGYLHMKVEEKDLFGDDTKELILWLCGGSSGMCGEVQVLSLKDGEWSEEVMPEKLWDSNFVEIKKKKNKIEAIVGETEFKKEFSVKEDEEICGVSYINCSLEGDKIVVSYDVYCETSGEIVGKILQYVEYENGFVLGKTDSRSIVH